MFFFFFRLIMKKIQHQDKIESNKKGNVIFIVKLMNILDVNFDELTVTSSWNFH